ncbi:hypothetical protein LBMAG53_28260 [Planctomycetota bacterium]|nr:hypothetical protein LBMAG53_28260 [Planctomycetota bacterium]
MKVAIVVATLALCLLLLYVSSFYVFIHRFSFPIKEGGIGTCYCTQSSLAKIFFYPISWIDMKIHNLRQVYPYYISDDFAKKVGREPR